MTEQHSASLLVRMLLLCTVLLLPIFCNSQKCSQPYAHSQDCCICNIIDDNQCVDNCRKGYYASLKTIQTHQCNISGTSTEASQSTAMSNSTMSVNNTDVPTRTVDGTSNQSSTEISQTTTMAQNTDTTRPSTMPPPIDGNMVCQKCHPTCWECSGPAKTDCLQCQSSMTLVTSTTTASTTSTISQTSSEERVTNTNPLSTSNTSYTPNTTTSTLTSESSTVSNSTNYDYSHNLTTSSAMLSTTTSQVATTNAVQGKCVCSDGLHFNKTSNKCENIQGNNQCHSTCKAYGGNPCDGIYFNGTHCKLCNLSTEPECCPLLAITDKSDFCYSNCSQTGNLFVNRTSCIRVNPGDNHTTTPMPTQTQWYEKLEILLPSIGGFVLIIIIIVVVSCCCCKRKRGEEMPRPSIPPSVNELKDITSTAVSKEETKKPRVRYTTSPTKTKALPPEPDDSDPYPYSQCQTNGGYVNDEIAKSYLTNETAPYVNIIVDPSSQVDETSQPAIYGNVDNTGPIYGNVDQIRHNPSTLPEPSNSNEPAWYGNIDLPLYGNVDNKLKENESYNQDSATVEMDEVYENEVFSSKNELEQTNFYGNIDVIQSHSKR